MRLHRRVVGLAIAAVVSALSLVGCGSDDRAAEPGGSGAHDGTCAVRMEFNGSVYQPAAHPAQDAPAPRQRLGTGHLLPCPDPDASDADGPGGNDVAVYEVPGQPPSRMIYAQEPFGYLTALSQPDN